MKTFVLTWVKIPGTDGTSITTKWYIIGSDEFEVATQLDCTILKGDHFKDHYKVSEGEHFLSKSKIGSFWIISEAKEVNSPPPEMK